jgi:hypothetical protein
MPHFCKSLKIEKNREDLWRMHIGAVSTAAGFLSVTVSKVRAGGMTRLVRHTAVNTI